MTVDIVYLDGCLKQKPTLHIFRDALRDLGVDVTVREVEVRSAEDAFLLHFFGSPTVQVEGEGIDPAVSGQTDYSFSSRLYGRAGTPPRHLIERAVCARMGW